MTTPENPISFEEWEEKFDAVRDDIGPVPFIGACPNYPSPQTWGLIYSEQHGPQLAPGESRAKVFYLTHQPCFDPGLRVQYPMMRSKESF